MKKPLEKSSNQSAETGNQKENRSGELADITAKRAAEVLSNDQEFRDLIAKLKGKLTELPAESRNGALAELLGMPADFFALLENPSVRALLAPPTELEIQLAQEVEEMMNGTRPAPEKYPRVRSKGKPSPVAFLREHYGKYLDAGCLYSDQLRKIDSGLVKAIENFTRNLSKEGAGNLASVNKYLPRERDKVAGYGMLPEYLLARIMHIGHVFSARKRRTN